MSYFPRIILILSLSCIRANAEATSPEKLAQEIRIPRIEFRDATAREAIEFIRKKSRELLADPERTLNINHTADEPFYVGGITCSFVDVPVLEVLRFIAHEKGLAIGATENGIYLYPAGQFDPVTKNLRELGWSGEKTKIRGTVIYSTGQRDAFLEAAQMLDDSVKGDRLRMPKEVRLAIDALRKRAEETEKRAQVFNERLEVQQDETDPRR
jgi:hypothetical protein